MTDREKREWLKCWHSPLYFISQYCQIYDATLGVWIPFSLWEAQADTLRTIVNNRLTIILKARQLGLTWLCLAFALWLMLFKPIATVLIFSKRDEEATYLLGKDRMRGMYHRLPGFMHVREIVTGNEHTWALSNGSVARAFPTSGGDSYTATFALVDEADLVDDLGKLMTAVKPTIDGGGRMILLSRAKKDEPESRFKQIYWAAKQKLNEWAAVFLPWHVRPERAAAWYDAQVRDAMANTGSLDDVHEQYPATDAEALAPRSSNKRIPAAWLLSAYHEERPRPLEQFRGAPSIPGLELYRLPQPGHRYAIGLDPAEGNPTSDDSALEVIDRDTGEEVACLADKLQPSTLASHADAIGRYYNGAGLLCERNNHGHAVILWLKNFSKLRVLKGHDSREEGGWLSNSKGKALMYDSAADAFRYRSTIVHSPSTYRQLTSIEGSSLRAPEGQHDDRADAYCLALIGDTYDVKDRQVSVPATVAAVPAGLM